MTIVQVNKYIINFRTAEEKTIVKIFYKLQETDVSEIIEIKDPQNIKLVIDMLRYEKPIFWATSSKVLMTSPEEIGEE
ncbi:MAG: hypothetical protein GF329_16750, partial [Candidatus Lokiarchaeota archaeon]|nr:hypothetical protein [Candidatus Lokiarchaeota archaeon]